MDKFHWRVNIRKDDDMAMAGFLDMMRYCRGIIRKWDNIDERRRWAIEFSTDGSAYAERWASFGIYLESIE
jgi:hypothetical protein